MCNPALNPVSCVPEAIAKATANGFFEELATQTTEAAAVAVKTVTTIWLQVPTPNVAGPDGSASGAVAYLQGYTTWIVASLAVAAVLVAAIRMALERNGREGASLAKGLVMLVVISTIGVATVQLLIEIGDAYSTWIIDKAADVDFGRVVIGPAAATALSSAVTPATPLLISGVALFLLITAITQILLLIGRSAALLLLAGLLPVAAAAGISGGARQMRDKYIAWLIAFLLYKPVAATIYAAAFLGIGKGETISEMIVGIVLFLMALVALPALMRLVTSAVGAVSGGGGGGAAAIAGVGAGSQLASGAMKLGGGKKNAVGGGGGEDSGPSGSGNAPPAGATPSKAPTGSGGSAGGSAAAGGGPAAAAGSGSAGTGAAAAGGPAGIAVAAGVEVGRKVVSAVPQAAKAVGGTAAAGATGADG